ncbi:MAG: GTP cyclohydrolase II [Terriglobia bacterium]
MKPKQKKRRHLRKAAEAHLPTRFGRFRIVGLENGRRQWLVALIKGNPARAQAPLVRIHSQCLTGDVFSSRRCDCRDQLELAMRRIAAEKTGVILYEPQEGRGIGLMNKLRAYRLQDRGYDTVEANRRLGFPADRRDYSLAAAGLHFLKLTRVRLLSNNPEKVMALERAGIQVVQRLPCQPAPARGNRAYLRVKKRKLGHLLRL